MKRSSEPAGRSVTELGQKKEESRRKLILSAVVFFACYLAVLLIVFLMFIINDPTGWKMLFRDRFSDVFSIVVSVFFLFGIGYFYFYFEDREFLYDLSNVVLFSAVFIFSAVICYVFGRFVSIYARPYAMFALLWLFLKNRRQALFFNFLFAFFMFSVDLFGNDPALIIDGERGAELVYTTMLLGFVSGTIAVFFANKVKSRIGLLLTGFLLAVPTALILFFFQIPNAEYNWIYYVSSVGFQVLGCIVSSVCAIAFMPLFEAVFNRLTTFRLRELTSTNAALLVRLKAEAPGTFNHSLIVAQLAESCAVAIGENAELARAAAYYHDVGKLKQPDCFTENQTDYNVHNEITPELSADIIRSHARDGYDLLVQNHLPKEIADVARQHHGTLPIKYFYDKAVRYSGYADLKDFSYLGPIPQTKIAAIIMIADAAEAAARASMDRSPENVEKLCRSIIEERMDLKQFDECDITIKELTIIKMTLVEALSGVHHHRVEYPDIRFNRDRQAVKTDKEGTDV